MMSEVDRDKYQRLVELGWLKAFAANISEVSYRVTERGKSRRLTLLKVGPQTGHLT